MRSSSRRTLYLFAGVALAASSASTLIGCDTVAEIAIDQRGFNGIESSGVVHSDQSGCEDTDFLVRLDFSLFDGSSNLIFNGDQLTPGQVTVGGSNPSFTTNDVSFSSGSVLFPLPEQECNSDTDCTAPFTCEPTNPYSATGGDELSCGAQVDLEVQQSSLTFEGDRDDDAFDVVILMDYSASLIDDPDMSGFQGARGTDPSTLRLSAATTMVLSMRRSPWADDSHIRTCVARFGGEGPAGVEFLPETTPDRCMTADFDVTLSQLSSTFLSVNASGGSPLWDGIVKAIDERLALGPASRERHLVVFTDGEDDGSLVSDFLDATTAAVDNNVIVHVIQLDNLPDPSDPSVNSDVNRVNIGPIDELARLACQTGGTFQYVNHPRDLREAFSSLANTMFGRYSFDLQVGRLNDADVPAGPYAVAAAMTVNLLEISQTFNFAGNQSDNSGGFDNRFTVFRRPAPARPTFENVGTTGN
ncbi:MAG: VWA domain-containing protein [Myxococcales bacterium]|nr:VWA domain-containing protein [Myxococcales bacterium]